MTTIHSLLVALHIALGTVALILFWVPVAARKGSPLHVQAGRIYAPLMYAVSITALIASLLVLADPLGVRRPGELFAAEQAARLSDSFRMFSLFLLMLSVLVIASVRHGLLALRDRSEPGVLGRRSHLLLLVLLAMLSLAVLAVGLVNRQILLLVFSVIGLVGFAQMLRDARRSEWTHRARIIAHLNGLIGSGIGAYTAFFAFGGSRFLAEWLPGQWQVVPWVLPSIIGTIAINRVARRYRSSNRLQRQLT